MIRKGAISSILGLILFATAGVCQSSAAPLTIGYSDWPGWVAFQVAIDKGWFKEAGVDVNFQWFDYSASMDAFAAGKIDANLMTNGDTLATGAGGGKGIMIMLTLVATAHAGAQECQRLSNTQARTSLAQDGKP